MSSTVRARCARAAGLLLLFAGCAEEAPPPKPVARPVKILAIAGPGAARTLEYSGQIEAAQHAELGFEVPGRIVALPVNEGQEVERGAELARLDPRDYQADLDAVQAQVRAARAEFDRVQTLYDREVTSEQELERARRTFEVAEARLRSAEKAVEDAVLRAPIAGVVARKLVDDYRNVQAKEPVVVLQDTSSLEIVVAVPERDWVWARRDTAPEERTERVKPRVVVSNYPGREIPAVLREVATTADPSTRTYAVTLGFEAPPDLNVLPGMTAKAALEVSGPRLGSRVEVPAQAVAQDQGPVPYVWRVDPATMTVSRVEVELGELSGSRVEIVRGLGPGDRIAVSGVQQLREGMAVRPFEP